jgi:hypothetical protein
MSGPTTTEPGARTDQAATHRREAGPSTSAREPGSIVAPYLDDGVEAGTLFKVLSRSYVALAATLVVLSFFASTDDDAWFRDEYGAQVAQYPSWNLWTMLAKAGDLGCFGFLFMLALVVCGIVAAFRRLVRRRPGLDLAIAVVAALYILLLVTKPDYRDEAEPELLLAGQVTVAVLAVMAALGLIMEVLRLSPGRRS